MEKKYYEILGVSASATQDEIKKAFRKKAHELHPDKKQGDETKFKEINEAYQVLGDPQKRQHYDQFGTAGMGGAGSSGSGGGFSADDFMRQGPFGFRGGGAGFDINLDDLGDLFGDVFGGRAQSNGSRRARGQDIRLDLTLPFEEAVFGTERTFEVKKAVACEVCVGSGAEPGSSKKTCPTCQGSGVLSQIQQTLLGQMRTQTQCPSCRGEGTVVEKKCQHCSGEGVVERRVELEVKIPAGIEDGQSIRLQGQGEAAHRNGTAGDLYVVVRVLASKVFKREGEHLFSEQEISFPQAALGATIEVQTVDGAGELKLPSGTQPGQVFRLKGKGAPRLGSSHRGDHFITIKVQVPRKLSRHQKALLKDFEE